MLAVFAAAVPLGFRRVNAHPETQRAESAPVRPNVSFADYASDGTPDFLRLEDECDREAFRHWFSFLAEVQYFEPATERPNEVVDCAALVRYAYREALRRHDSLWASSSHLLLVPSFDSIRKYNFPHTPLGPALFRRRPGPFARADLENGAFGQFANAETLERFNTFLISRNAGAARPGDLLFFRRSGQELVFHTMIFIGRSQIAPDSAAYLVYHTGPNAAGVGEIRRLSLKELLHYPDPEWQPRSSNPVFLGVFRWNILRSDS
jgi:uncharacterized protein